MAARSIWHDPVIKGTDLFGPVSFPLVAKITLTIVFHRKQGQNPTIVRGENTNELLINLVIHLFDSTFNLFLIQNTD